MKPIPISILSGMLFSLSFFHAAHAQTFLWAGQQGGPESEVEIVTTVDADGYVYTAGNFNGTADFDPGPLSYTLTGSNTDVFISKLTSSGNFVWARQIGGYSAQRCYGIFIDPGGNILITGEFYDTTDFDPGTGTYNLVAV